MAKKKEPVVSLVSAVEAKSKNAHTQSLDLSFNEILDMKKAGEIDISPDFQRLFVWSEGARSRFIESLLLEMPIPPIYVVEEDDGKYLLIDGLQRISSYLHLRGELEALHLETPVKKGDKLVLQDCDIVPELNGKTFEDLGTALQIRLKRAFVRVEVVRKGSNAHFKYHMFKRLNTGGATLSTQQIRNCTIRLLNPKFIDFIDYLSKERNFRICVESLTYQQNLDAFDKELILRFFSFKNNRAAFKHDVGDFMTEYMEYVSDPDGPGMEYDHEKNVFLKTFQILGETLAEYAFGYQNKRKPTELTRAFGIYHYESLTLGLQKRLDDIDPKNKQLMASLSTLFKKIKLDRKFVGITTGGGRNSPGLLKERIKFVENKIETLFK